MLLIVIWFLFCIGITSPTWAANQGSVPGKPTGVQAAAGNGQAAVSFQAPASDGGSAITAYTVTASDGTTTAAGTASPIIVPGLDNGTAYTFTVTAANGSGAGKVSNPSNYVTPSETCLDYLAGTWNLNMIAAGADVPWWERASVTINPDGTVSGSGTDSNGTTEQITGAFWSFPGGLWPQIGGNPDAGALCQVDQDNLVFACTGSHASGGFQLTMGAKQAGSQSTYSANDLAGDWEGSFLTSGLASGWWTRFSGMKVNSDGTFSASENSSFGSAENITGELEISQAGQVTCPAGCWGDPGFQAFMDAGKTVIVGTGGASAASPDANLYVLARKAASYSMADLAGHWEVNQLDTGPNAGWHRYSLEGNPDGTLAGSEVSSNGTTEKVTGLRHISSAGVISCSGCGGDFRGFMNEGKTVWVITCSDGMSGSLRIGTKTKVPKTGTLSVTINPSAAVSAGAQWQIDGTGAWYNSGDEQTIATGRHAVSFSEIQGWITPAAKKVTVTKNSTTKYAVTYYQPVQALMSFTITSGVRTVSFTDKSTGSVIKRRWNFGDGTTSGKQTVTHTFKKAGTYTVKLTVWGAGGDKQSVSNTLNFD